jgi:penicillin amidase
LEERELRSSNQEMAVKKLKIAGIVLIVLIAIAAIAGALFVRSVARRGLPDYDVTVALSGISQEVIVYRDAFGIPHVYAQTEDDLYRAVGYCMAQDRLWQMDLLRRVCTGRLSEIFGEDLVETDLLMRSLRIPEKSRLVLERTDGIRVNSLQAFADGVNQYIEAHQKKLPPEFSILRYKPEKWLPEHSLHLVGYMAWDLSLSWNTEVLLDKIKRRFGEAKASELLPDMTFFHTLVYPTFESKLAQLDLDRTLLNANRRLRELGLEVFRGSNNWAVSGDRSVTGKPILANDMHLGLNSPGIWYQMHQMVGGGLNVTGVVLPGQPFVVAGHNDRIAWGFTNVMVDNTDFYLEKLDPDHPDQYELNGEWRKIQVQKEEIKIKGGGAVQDELRFTHRGPIISRFHEIDDLAISMRWVGNDFSDELRTIYLLNRAGNWDEFKDAMRTFISVSQNTVYADVEGNIGLSCAAGIPIRKGGETCAILPGWADEYDWKGMVPFEELPHSFNPENGFVSSANNKTVGDEYPHYISRWFALSYRIDRIQEMLAAKDKFSIEDFKRMQADKRSKLVEKIRDSIVSKVDGSENLTDLERNTLKTLSSWDGVLVPASPEAAVFEKFLGLLLKNLFLDELGKELYTDFITSPLLYEYAVHRFFGKKDSLWCDDVGTEGVKETFATIIQKSFKDTVVDLKADLGSDPKGWQWGKLHQLTLVHPLGSVKLLDRLFKFNRGPYEVGGSYHTVCYSSYPFSDPFGVTVGASHRHIYPLDNWDGSLTVIPTGVSGIPASPHYCDQTKLYVENRYHSDYFSRDLVQKNAKYRMIIKGK